MTKKEAFMAALRGEQPDIVPVSPLIHWRYANKILGRRDWRAVFEVHQQLGSTHFRGPIDIPLKSKLPQDYRYSEEVLFQKGPHRITRTTLHTPIRNLSCTTNIGLVPGDPYNGKQTDYFVKSREDWEIFIKMWNEAADTAELDFGQDIVDACKEMGEEGVANGSAGPAYAAMAGVRGMAELLFDIIDEPDLMKEVAKASRRVGEKHLDAFIASPAQVCYYDIAWGTGSDMGPERFEEWHGDEIRQACDKVRAAGKYITFYAVGKIGKLLDGLVDAGPHMIATFEQNENDITMAEAKKRYGQKICLMGNFDCVLLARGTLDDARKEARRCLDEGMKDGGYIMGTADEVPPDTKADNLRAMVDIVNEYGRY